MTDVPTDTLAPDPPPELLYGLDGAEHLDTNWADTAERRWDSRNDDLTPFDVYEWTVADPRTHLRTTTALLEDLTEWASEQGDENYWEDWRTAAAHQDVIDAFDTALALLASKVRYRMADRHVATITVTPCVNCWPTEHLGKFVDPENGDSYDCPSCGGRGYTWTRRDP